MEFVAVLAVLAAIVLFLAAPLRRAGGEHQHRRLREASAGRIAELEAARESKYREIRDAELDHLTGKLSETDYNQIDATLRAEAIEILRALDRERAHADDLAAVLHEPDGPAG